MVICNKCGSNDLDELVWLNLPENEVKDRTGEYHCNHCQARVDVNIAPDPDWIEDIEIIEEHEYPNEGDTGGNSS